MKCVNIFELLAEDNNMDRYKLRYSASSLPGVVKIQDRIIYAIIAYQTNPYDGSTHPAELKLVTIGEGSGAIESVIVLSEDFEVSHNLPVFAAANDVRGLDEPPIPLEESLSFVDRAIDCFCNDEIMGTDERRQVANFFMWYEPKKVFEVHYMICKEFFDWLF